MSETPQLDLVAPESDSSHSKPYLHQSGLEVSFVNKPPEEIQLECSICLQILRDPHIVGCDCGYSFCKNCIVKIQVRSCPLCNKEFHTALPNNRLSLTLNGLLIYCPHGCNWTGKLGELEKHFNQTPSEENRLEGCEFTDISCQYCNKSFPRKDIRTHEKDTCPNKPYTCEYCGHSSILDDITQNHWPICDKIPVNCPFVCGESPQQQNLEHHVKEDCLSAPVDCDFAYAGCSEPITRGSKADHLKNHLPQHMALISRQQRKNQTEAEALKAEVATLKEEVLALKKENRLLKEEGNRVLKQELEQKIESLATRNKHEMAALNSYLEEMQENCEWRFDSLESQANDLESDMNTKLEVADLPSPNSQVEFTVFNMKSLRREREEWISEPFYLKSRYRTVLVVYPYGNGNGHGTHLSVYLYIAKGKYDDMLKWPFVGEVTLTLVDQRLGLKDRTYTVEFTQDNSCGQRQYASSLTGGYGWQQFMEYSCLSPNYLVDDCLVFRINLA